MSTLQFFKHDELFAQKNVATSRDGEAGYAAAVQALNGYFDKLVNNRDRYIKDILGGYHRGYTPMTVADYLITRYYTDNAFVVDVINNANTVARSFLMDDFYEAMGYAGSNWGTQYGYHPSLEEREMDPIDVQDQINERAADRAKFIAGKSEQVMYFGTYGSGSGAVWNGEDLDKLKAFRTEVYVCIASRKANFLVEVP